MEESSSTWFMATRRGETFMEVVATWETLPQVPEIRVIAIARHSGAMREHLADGNRADVGAVQLGNMHEGLVIQPDPLLLHQLHDGDAGECLGVRGDPEEPRFWLPSQHGRRGAAPRVRSRSTACATTAGRGAPVPRLGLPYSAEPVAGTATRVLRSLMRVAFPVR